MWEQKHLARKLRGPRCVDCGQRRRLSMSWYDTWDDWATPVPEAVEPRCLPCHITMWLAEREAWEKAERRAKKATPAPQAQEVQAPREARLQARIREEKVQRAARDLTREGNIPLMRRLLRKGKTHAEILAVFTTMYHARGKTNKAWIKARVRDYRRVVEGE